MNPNVPLTLQRAMQTSQWIRNGRYPDANLYANWVQQVNQTFALRTKEAFRWATPIANLPSSPGTGAPVPRWRFAYQSSPFAYAMWFRGVLGPSTSHVGSDCRSILTLSEDPTYASTVGTATIHFGNNANLSGATDTPAFFGSFLTPLVDTDGQIIQLSTSVPHYGKFEDDDDGRLLAASVFEVALAPDTANGYIEDGSALTYGAPILDATRQNIATYLPQVWTYGGAQSWNWTVETTAITRVSSTTPLNVIDTTSTAVSAATPGATLDLRNRSTIRRTTVPMAFKAYGSNPSANGVVVLKDSTGTILATIAVTATDGWDEKTVDLPATLAKYDIQFASGAASTTTLYAVSLYPLI